MRGSAVVGEGVVVSERVLLVERGLVGIGIWRGEEREGDGDGEGSVRSADDFDVKITCNFLRKHLLIPHWFGPVPSHGNTVRLGPIPFTLIISHLRLRCRRSMRMPHRPTRLHRC